MASTCTNAPACSLFSPLGTRCAWCRFHGRFPLRALGLPMTARTVLRRPSWICSRKMRPTVLKLTRVPSRPRTVAILARPHRGYWRRRFVTRWVRAVLRVGWRNRWGRVDPGSNPLGPLSCKRFAHRYRVATGIFTRIAACCAVFPPKRSSCHSRNLCSRSPACLLQIRSLFQAPL